MAAPATDTGEIFSLPEPEGALIWVTVTEASKRTGVTPETLRAWQDTGRLRRRVVSTPDGRQEIVPLQEVQEEAARRPG